MKNVVLCANYLYLWILSSRALDYKDIEIRKLQFVTKAQFHFQGPHIEKELDRKLLKFGC